MSEFERLLQENLVPLQRYVNFKIGSKDDAEDVIQEVCLAAMENFETLNAPSSFKAWLIGIANHKCKDYYRRKAKEMQISLEVLSGVMLSNGRFGITEQSIVHDTLDALGDKEKQILYLYYFKNLSQEDISTRLSVPLGTVKSRLHYAKKKFKEHYPKQTTKKGEMTMKKLPQYLPQYTISLSEKEPFSIRHEELPGMLIIPRKGEKLSFGMYDFPTKKLTGEYRMAVTNDVILHGVQGVEIKSDYFGVSDSDEQNIIFAQLTDTFCRYLGGMTIDSSGARNIITFVDESFENAYGIGKNNCGFEVDRVPAGKISLLNNDLCAKVDEDISDIVGRYTVTFAGEKAFDTVRLIDIENGTNGYMMAEYYLDKKGRTILWRRFNKNDWAYKRYGKLWTEMLPENERIVINGETYVHWYDCVTDYIF